MRPARIESLPQIDLRLLADFCDPLARGNAARRLASGLGGSHLILFVYDAVVGAYLPAPGFPQRLPSGRLWGNFLNSLQEDMPSAETLPNPFTGSNCPVVGIKVQANVCFVLLDATETTLPKEDLRDLAWVVAFGIKGEFAVQSAAALSQHAAESEAKAFEVSVKLDDTRRELQEANTQLKAANVELEARVLERTAELTSAYKELEGFTYTVAHDLRSPIRGIVGLARITVDDYPKFLPKEGIEHLNDLSQAALKLAKLVEDLLAFARLGRGHIKKSQVDLTRMAKDVVAEISLRYGSAVKAQIDEGLMCEGDPALLKIVLENLFDNAIKYAKPGRAPGIRFTCDNSNRFVVEDEGIGFEPDYNTRIFGLFERLHRDDQIRGTGIGLANVKRIVERHGGTIFAEGQADKGAKFTFCLPLR